MKNHFKFINAKEYCSNIFDGTHDTPQPIEQGYKLLTSKNISQGILDKTTSYYISEEDYNSINLRSEVSQWDILFSMIGTVGNTCLILESDIDYAIKNIGVFSTNNEYKAKWLYIYLNSYIAKRYINKFLSGAVQKYITLDMLRNFPILIPYYDERYFVDLYWKITNKIQLNNSINDELEKMAKTLYDYWFVQFDFPDENGRPYKSSGGKMVWNEKLKREIPYGWVVKNIADNPFTSLISIGVDYFNSKNYLATKNINGEIISDGEWITFENRETRANMQPQINSIWFAKMQNSIKHITLPNNSQWFINKYILSTGFFGLKCQKDSLSYIHCFINSKYFERKKDILAHGATQKAVNNNDLVNIPLIIPPINILKKFNDYIYNLLEMKLELIKQNQALTSLREFLLPLLMNGQAVIKE